MSKLDKAVIDNAIENCVSIDYPIQVTGQDFGDDLANALNVIKNLLDRIDKLEKVIERQPTQK